MMTTSTMIFKMHLERLGFSPQKYDGKWVIWESPPSGIDSPVKGKIKRLLVELTSNILGQQCLVQFWALEQPQQHQQLYLTTLDQPFAVCGRAPYGYRERCMGNRYRVDEGADDKELGAVGRVYRNKRPESTPDLRLYSNNEFPLRDDAYAYSLRSYCALPLFDIKETDNFYGVLEFLTYDDYYTLTEIQISLEAAQLRTNHLDLGGSFKEADSKIMEMLQLAKRVMPQLQTANVWIPCHECTNTNNSSCMEISHTMVVDILDSIWRFSSYYMRRYRKACGWHHLQIGEFANMPAIIVYRNVCDFSISDNPLTHYAQKARLCFCFAVRLQSSHNSTRDFKVVEFFLQCNNREDEFYKLHLPLLLRVMEMKLKKYKFAYGGELEVGVGESSALRCESIKYNHQHSKEISMLNKIEGCDHIYIPPDGRRWAFWSRESEAICENESSLGSDIIQERVKCLMNKMVAWNGYVPQSGTKWYWSLPEVQHVDKQVQFAPSGVESIAQEEAGQCNTAEPNLKKKDAAEEVQGRKRKTRLDITFEDLKPYFGRKLKYVVKEVGVSRSTMKHICRDNGMNNLSIFVRGSAKESTQQNISNLPVSDIALPQDDPQSSRGSIVEPKVDMVVIKAKYEDDTIRIELCRSAGLEKLLDVVGRKLNLSVGSFKLKYMDEDDDEILLACDDDLQHFLKISTAMDKPYYIQVFVKLM